MYPILFESTARSWNTAGLGGLRDCTAFTVTESRNSGYEASMTYPVSGNHYKDINVGCIVLAKPNAVSDPQPFRIYGEGKELGGMVTYNLEHISYELSKKVLPAGKYWGNPQQIMTAALNNCLYNNGYTATSDIPYAVTVNQDKPTNVREFIGGSSSLLEEIGGELEYDGMQIRLWHYRGSDKGVTIRRRKNLTGYNQSTDGSGLYTHIYPYATTQVEAGDESVDVLVELPEKLVELPGAATLGYQSSLPVDLSSEFEDGEAVNAYTLRLKTLAWIEDNNPRKFEVNATVQFVDLSKTLEYQGLDDLYKVGLCDTIRLIDERTGIDAKMKVIKTIYDSLREQYESIELGEVKETLSNKRNKFSFGVQNGFIGNIASLIFGWNGTNTIQRIDMSAVRQSYADDETDTIIKKGTVRFDANTFIVAADNFSVDSEGHVSATDGKFDGVLYCDGMKVPQIQTGKIVCQVDEPDTVKTYNIVFDRLFDEPPQVLMTPLTTEPQRTFASPKNITTAGFDLSFYRDNTVATTVSWTAFL